MRFFCITLLVCVLSLQCYAGRTNKVLIIGIDGTIPQYLLQMQTPNIDAIRTNGCYSYRAITHPVTHSAACWTAMFTGVWGDKNGVNDLNNAFNGTQFGAYPNFMKRLETVNSNWNTVAFLRWSPLSTALSGTDLIQSFSSDDAITTATCQRLTNANPDVFYTILLDVDSAGHSPGWDTATYKQAIQSADVRVGKIMGALTNRVSYSNENWLVIVMSDHGKHDDPNIEKSRVTFHIVSGENMARGEMLPSPSIVDVCATVLTHMGVTVDPAWNLDARLEGHPLPAARYGTNLIFNGDAESTTATNNYYISDDNQKIDRGIAWWFDGGMVTLGQYGAHPKFPSTNSVNLSDPGKNFFLGGVGTNNVITQTICVTNLAGDIDRKAVNYELSGYLGGAGSNDACFTFTARFLNDVQSGLDTNAIGPVTAADRTNSTCLLKQEAHGILPPGTRYIQFVLSAQSTIQTNNALADNLAFILSSDGDSPPTLSMLNRFSAHKQVSLFSQTNRFYMLERTMDFQSWTPLGMEIQGTGNMLSLTDSNSPSSHSFYRVRSWKP